MISDKAKAELEAFVKALAPAHWDEAMIVEVLCFECGVPLRRVPGPARSDDEFWCQGCVRQVLP